jgi:ElaB/YqjD/DUF883 family membrane-anchored ribosome-binding protein
LIYEQLLGVKMSPSDTAKAKNRIQEQVAVLEGKGQSILDYISQRVEDRPYSTLGFAVGVGFLFGAIFKGRR